MGRIEIEKHDDSLIKHLLFEDFGLKKDDLLLLYDNAWYGFYCRNCDLTIVILHDVPSKKAKKVSVETLNHSLKGKCCDLPDYTRIKGPIRVVREIISGEE